MKAMRTNAFGVLVLVNFLCTGLHAGAEGVSLKLQSPFGEMEAVVTETGDAKITKYPTIGMAEFDTKLLASPFGIKDLSLESCSQVREKSEKLVNSHLPENMKRQLRNQIRAMSTGKVEFKFPDFVSSTWLKKEIIRAAKLQSLELTSVKIANPLEYTSLKVAIQPRSTSIYALLGEDTLLTKQVESLFNSNTLAWGSVSREFSQLDFLCDLVHEDLQLTLVTQGIEKNVPVFAQIIPLTLAKELSNNLQDNRASFLTEKEPFNLTRNFMIAGVVAERFWKTTNYNNVEISLWTKMLEQLLDSTTGVPKYLTEQELTTTSRYIVSSDTPYTSTIQFKPVKEGEPE